MIFNLNGIKNKNSSYLEKNGINNKIDVSKILNLAKHKDKDKPTNKRYLSSIENYFKKHIYLSN
ncbi:hypothetical protein RhiirA4_488004 [Rhizophagus irregularis]|uniref:Uncharacterized protein n=1 Tax=Rhizophagus irregularis TaxID=588596 RepID=A0A2I1HT69_9GLOM|nr:hypothetical protein RhiirA4_488004 [Rhizophagus irregularis]